MLKNLFILILLFSSLQSFGHGENNPGPNGGFIRMPGAFHTELVFDKNDNSFYLYLLDINFKNPTAKNSFVEAVLEQKHNKSLKFACEVINENHFQCKTGKWYSKDSGKLTLLVKRDEAEGTAIYNLPLKWENQDKVDHSMHH